MNKSQPALRISDCIFCQIIEGTQVASIVYQDDLITGFLDIRPINPGHLLVTPNNHARSLGEVDDEVVGRIFKVGKHLAQKLRHTSLQCEDVNLHMADGPAAGQTVFHTHLHVIPRFQGDGFGFLLQGHTHRAPTREELDAMAKEIRGATSQDSKSSNP